ncbi:MAG TPA: ATP synthase F1 subunit delta [Actinomycetota bacterium]|nr:ATP synthase F1 subunit delta [Actinomycetota bacterium]
MAEDRLIEGYAEALFAIAQAEGSLGDVEDELYQFAKTMERDGRLREVLVDPTLPADRKRSVIEEILGERASRHAINLLSFLVDQGRARQLTEIVEALAETAAGRNRKTLAEVRTAIPLDIQRRARLEEALAKATGRDVELKVVVDPSVIGGVVVKVGDQVFDGTVRRKLDVARNQLARAR